MMTIRLRYAWILWCACVVSTMLLVHGCGESDTGRAKANEPITIACAAPLTGDDGYIGEDQRRGAELAVAHLNSLGGILGRPVKLLVEDDQGRDADAASVAHRLCQDKSIVAVIGHLNSHCSNAAAPIYSRSGLTMMTPISTADNLTRQGYRNVFRMCIRNSDQAPALAKHAAQQEGWRRLAIVHDNRDYGKDLAEQFRDVIAAEYSTATVVAFETITPSDTNYRSVLAKLKGSSPDAIFFGGMARQAALLMKQSRELGLSVPFMGGDGMYSRELVDRAGEAAEGAVISHIAPLAGRKEATREFLRMYREKYDEDVRAYAPLSYDCVMVIARALEHAEEVDRAALVAALHDNTVTYSGLTGDVRFDGNGDRSVRLPYLYRVEHETFVMIDHE